MIQLNSQLPTVSEFTSLRENAKWEAPGCSFRSDAVGAAGAVFFNPPPPSPTPPSPVVEGQLWTKMVYRGNVTWLDRGNSCNGAVADDESKFIMPGGYTLGSPSILCAPRYSEPGQSLPETVCRNGKEWCLVVNKVKVTVTELTEGTDRLDPQYICKGGGPSPNSTAPVIKYLHNYNSGGKSKWAECHFSQFKSQVVIPGLAPFWTEETNLAALKLPQSEGNGLISQKLVVLPADYSGKWHPDPEVQLNVFISGKGVWTTEDGVEKQFGPGDFYLGDDAGTKGHLSMSVGGEPMVLLCTQFNVSRAGHADTPCWL